MLILSDENSTGISGTFPFPYGILSTVQFFSAERRIWLTPALIVMELMLAIALLLLLIINPEPMGLTAFSIGFPCVMVAIKFIPQKKVTMKRSEIEMIGMTPKSLWCEHVLLCSTLALTAMWANQMQGISLFGPSFFSAVIVIACLCAAWPFMNLACQRLYNPEL
jgi:hypothetical protein